jgi:hypothetical protein
MAKRFASLSVEEINAISKHDAKEHHKSNIANMDGWPFSIF